MQRILIFYTGETGIKSKLEGYNHYDKIHVRNNYRINYLKKKIGDFT